MDVKGLLKELVERNGSDLFLRAGSPVRMRIDGTLSEPGGKPVSVEEMQKIVCDVASEQQRKAFEQCMDVDFALYVSDFDRRFRVSIFIQRNTPSIVIRNVNNVILDFDQLHLPGDTLKKLCQEARGLVLLTGSMGSGKSTAIASMIEYINNNSCKHVLTIEEPIEFTFKDKRSLINQRELGLDVSSYPAALRAFTLQSPDVIFIGNIRDAETMKAAMTAAETGVLVFSTLHTVNAPQTVERIVNFFPPYQHEEIRSELSGLLKGTISLRLLSLKKGGGRIPAYEIMLLSPTIARLIRENNLVDIPKFIEEGEIYGMKSFKQSLIDLVKQGTVSQEDALAHSDNADELLLSLKGIGRV
ncbi:MAG: PilT/PilU family type 4a pilus ATPase [Candidatus Omnitrophica bacterium]|nr:PilT/PilU family type 4a pilus ATPase [Candidatus Omnitrophota bacterium]